MNVTYEVPKRRRTMACGFHDIVKILKNYRKPAPLADASDFTRRGSSWGMTPREMLTALGCTDPSQEDRIVLRVALQDAVERRLVIRDVRIPGADMWLSAF